MHSLAKAGRLRTNGRLVSGSACAVLLLLAAGPTTAELFRSNVPGGSFDTPLALDHWAGVDFDFITDWSFVDLEDSTSSGSLVVSAYDEPNIPFAAWSACRVAVPGREYRFGAWQLIPAGQAGSAFVRLELQWLGSCARGVVLATLAFPSSVVGEWTPIEGTGVTPPAVGGMRIQLIHFKTSEQPNLRVAHFDEVFLPEPAAGAAAAILALALLHQRRPWPRRGRD